MRQEYQMATINPSLLQKLNLPPLGPPIERHPPSAAAFMATRRSAINLTASFLLSTHIILTKPVSAFEFTMTVPDQTAEEALSGIQSHAQSLLKVKDLLEAESWREAQKMLRKSSALLKQDIYTIIQAKPANERPRLRKLYSDLFNTVTRLDYAARDMDRIRVLEYYDGIVLFLDDILSRL